MLGFIVLSLLVVTGCHGYVPRCNSDKGLIPPGKIYPDADMTIFAGEILTLHCMVNVSSLSNRFEVAEIFFTTNDDPHSKARKIKPVLIESNKDMMSFKMSDHITEDILNSHPQRKYQSYVCRYSDNNTFCPIDYKFIQIDYRPQKPENGHCKVYNWQTMTCMWDLKVLYRHANLSAGWSVDWTVHDAWSACPNQSLNGTCLVCIWKAGHGQDAYRRETYLFRITVDSGSRNVSQSISEKINTRQFVEPKEVQGLVASPNKTFITLTWTHSNHIEDKRYRIRYSSQWTNFTEEKEINLDGNKIEKYLIRELTPYTTYQIKVDVIPLINGTEMGYWSKVEMAVTRTLEDVPGKNPKLFPHFYECADNECNNATIYWQPTSIKDRHGVLTEYIIWIENMTDHSRSKVIIIQDTSTIRYNLYLNNKDNNNTYKIFLSQRTKEGKAKQDSFFYILPKATRPPQAKVDWVEANGTHVYIRWQNPSNMEIEWNGIVYCKGTYDTGCQDVIKTIIVRNTTSYYIDMGTDISEYDNYIFGVSTITHTTKSYDLPAGKMTGSPIYWSRCNYHLDGVPDRPLKIKRDNITDADNFHIKWEPYTCDEVRGHVTRYIVTYCVQNTSILCTYKNGKKVKVVSTISSYTIENVEKGKTYFVWVQAKLHNENISPIQTDPIEMFVRNVPAQPVKEADLHTVYIAVGVAGGVVFIIFIALLIAYFVWKHCHVSEEDIAIDLPTIRKASNSSKSSDGGYDGSGESKNLKDSEIKKEEIIPLIPKFPPPKIPSESDSNNDSGCQGNGGIPDEKRDEIDDYDVTSSGDVETYFKQAGSTFSTNRGGSSIGNKTDSIHYPVDRNKDSITNIQETVNQTSSEKEDKSVDDISVIEPYVKQTFDSEKNIPKLTDVSGNNKTGRLLTTVPVTLTTGTVLNMNQFVPQDSSAQSVDSYVQNTMENSAASIPNDYVRHEDAIYNYQGQGQADLSGYNSDLLISTSDSMNNYTSGGSIDNYVQQDYNGDGSNLCR